ncbi:MAG: hypothetical protein IPK19_25120 [Chloroflexi bacterium]|nr:hypothetical protein [Chloroflexota bacterium]
MVAIARKDHDSAEQHFMKSLEIGRALNNLERLARDYIYLAVLNYNRREFEAALDYFMQASVVAEYLQHGELMNWCWWNIGALYGVKSECIRASRKLHLAQGQAKELGLAHAIPNISLWLGMLHLRQYQFEPARTYFSASLMQSAQLPRNIPLALYGLALADRYEHDLAMLNSPAEAALKIAETLDGIDVGAAKLEAVKQEDLERAQEYFQTAMVDSPGIEGYHIVPALGSWLSRQ